MPSINSVFAAVFATVFAATSLLSASAIAADKVLIISGGGSPAGNHYSQYLQTKLLTDHLRTEFPSQDVTVFFGAGNSPNQTPALADVHRAVKINGLSYETMLVGAIDGNSAAYKENVLGYFSQPELSALTQQDRLFVFVSDHGMPNMNAKGETNATFSNNCIDLWSYQATGGDRPFPQRCLSKNELGQALTRKVSPGRVVFAMSQCYSGGFHQMSVTSEAGFPKARTNLCGFTAITEDTTASGCTPDVDGPGYQGYERYFTEQLSGRDVVSGQVLRKPRSSMKAAHEAATLQDMTVDIPISTSDYYLIQWAKRIIAPNFKPRTNTISAQEARRIFEGAASLKLEANTPDYLERARFVTQMAESIAQRYPELAATVRNGSLADLERVRAEVQSKADAMNERINAPYQRRSQLRMEVIWDAWVEAFRANTTNLTPDQIKMEDGAFAVLEAKYGLGEIKYWVIYQLAKMTPTDPKGAERLSRYNTEREVQIMSWAKTQKNPAVRQAALEIEELDKQVDQLSEEQFDLEKQHGLMRRLVNYRLGLGAWATLEAMRDSAGLRDLNGLLECESTEF